MDDRVAGVAIAIVIIAIVVYIVWSTTRTASCPYQVYSIVTGEMVWSCE